MCIIAKTSQNKDLSINKWITTGCYPQPVHNTEDNFLYLVANGYSDTKYPMHKCVFVSKWWKTCLYSVETC